MLAVGSLISVKQHAHALGVVVSLVKDFPGVALDIVGDGPLLPTLHGYVKQLGIADHVKFHGAVDHDQLPRFYQAADLHILTSQHEAFGMVVAEAAACGLPTVSYALGVLPEFAPDAGIAVPPGDVREVLSDPNRRRVMGMSARKIIDTRYISPI